MLIRHQDIAVLLSYYCGYSTIRNFIFRFQRKPVTQFVVFHDIQPESSMRFESNLSFLKKRTNVISFDNYLAGKLSSKKINVVITFDDGFKSCITCAVPILQKLALPATFFISSGFIGLSKDDETSFIHDNLGLKNLPHQKPSGGLTREDVKKMADLGFTIGGHTVNHAIISSIQDKDILQFEINEDKMAIEGLIGRKIDYFAYPAGAYNNAAINITEVLREAGYKAAVTTMAGFNNHTTNPFLLRRELTRASMPAQVFKASVYGNRDAVNILKKTMTFYRRLFDAT